MGNYYLKTKQSNCYSLVSISGISESFDLHSCVLFVIFELGSCYVAQAGLELMILLPKLPEWMSHRTILVIIIMGDACATAHVLRPEDRFEELILSFCLSVYSKLGSQTSG